MIHTRSAKAWAEQSASRSAEALDQAKKLGCEDIVEDGDVRTFDWMEPDIWIWIIFWMLQCYRRSPYLNIHTNAWNTHLKHLITNICKYRIYMNLYILHFVQNLKCRRPDPGWLWRRCKELKRGRILWDLEHLSRFCHLCAAVIPPVEEGTLKTSCEANMTSELKKFAAGSGMTIYLEELINKHGQTA